GADGLPEVLAQRLANRQRGRGVGVQDGGEPAAVPGRDALGGRALGRGSAPAGVVPQRYGSVGRLLGLPHGRVAENLPTNVTLTHRRVWAPRKLVGSSYTNPSAAPFAGNPPPATEPLRPSAPLSPEPEAR